MSQLPRYESYKDSGVQWLGEIPSHWDVKRMKFVVANVGDKIDAKESDLRYFGLENIESFTGKLLDSVELESEGIGHRFQKDDVLFGKLRPYLAKVFLAQEEGLSSTEALVFRSSEVIYPKFLSYYCLSQDFINEVNGTTFGSKMPRASWDNISSFRMVYPSLDEQKLIAGFLDKRLAQVDALIAKQETLLEKLAEQRVALISHAVTKGLNPDVEMKESGDVFFRKVPNHWKVLALHYIVRLVSGDSITALDFVADGDYPVYGGNGFRGYIDRYTHQGDYVLIGRQGALCGNINFATGSFFATEHAVVVNPLVDINFKWLGFLLMAMNLNQYSTTAAQPGISAEVIGRLKILLPDVKEQNQIAEYIENVLLNIGEFENKVILLKSKLKEYRSTLITQVVTGKIDVRNLKVN
ncbi:restriction endonuclease subunit S [Acinetobacter baumannii]|uniref:restriction endonuclease subunit S n=1 Tax=Acinetobacter calcoaceticus/baumannii complex TaxID=909768 RepID=UPI0002AEB34C|nr:MULTISPECIES: restriction endonuclease subunit S [Acinetobacter calcoaceticus/baumannii complex]ELW94819.1 type I restriction modification DNA specificity domain protein [Acinetobacter baumannii OIFC047]ELX07319.1 type I restriction modification DNA specificity domain protein [Acinetobacter baumannii Naval-57]EXE18167.1 type I restriction modification DNA specificity domain protein [Acinetobacter baumannii 1106579]MCG9505446.1 restriction endonuclease subunit S [Acinetobacter pittii]MDA3576